MIRSGSIRTGIDELPTMDLTYEAIIKRETQTFYGSGSSKQVWSAQGGVIPCDCAPIADSTAMGQSGELEVSTHVLHFGAGTNVQIHDSVQIVNSRNGFGPIGEWFYITELLLPAETLSFVRCRAIWGKQPTAEGDV